MATVNKEIADNIMAHNGYYVENGYDSGDARVQYVIKYKNQFNGEDAYAITYSSEQAQRYFDPDSAAIDPVVIWKTPQAPFFFSLKHQESLCSICRESHPEDDRHPCE